MNHPLARATLGAAILVPALLLSAAAAHAQELTVTAEGVRSDKGVLRIAIYDAEDRQVAARAVPAMAGRVVVSFDVPPGAYAARLYHDEDGDGRLAKGPFGRPREGYGFSNRATALFGVPSFDKMRVDVGAAPASTVATLRY